MSVSLTSICNMALAEIRADARVTDVSDATDGSTEATMCRLYLDTAVRSVFEEYDWRWVSRVRTLATHGDAAAPGYSYRYQLPSDCLVPREILIATRARNMDPIPFELELDEDGNEHTLLCDTANAQLRYTTDLFTESVEQWPGNFREAVKFKLARELALSVKKEGRTAEAMQQLYTLALEKSGYINQTGRYAGKPQVPASLRART